ncbi:MAG: IPT/TIG domain-containing protein, partial [Actinomycetota bacterium]|nr:IPT/TIG domain-containing protein [Actinomycetota bacterium]
MAPTTTSTRVATPGWRGKLCLAAVFVVLAVPAMMSGPTDAAGSSPQPAAITLFPLAPGSDPAAITAGPDGNMWFVESQANRIGRITAVDQPGIPAGTVTTFMTAFPGGFPGSITLGPVEPAGANIWFTEVHSGADGVVARMTPAGVVTPGGGYPEGKAPGPMTVTPDGSLWFGGLDDAGVPVLRRLPLNSGTTQVISLPPGLANSASGAIRNLTADSGGDLWGWIDQKIFHYSPSSGQFAQFPSQDDQSSMTLGSDHNIWVTNADRGLLRLTTTGPTGPTGPTSPTEFPIPAVLPDDANPNNPTQTLQPVARSLTAGPDGNLWFVVESGLSLQAKRIGRMTPDGHVRQFPFPYSTSPGQDFLGMAAGPDGNLWVTFVGPAAPPTNQPLQPVIIRYWVLPTAAQVRPAPVAASGGGATVTITGTGLDSASSVTVGTAQANIISRSRTQLVIMVPPGHGSAPLVVNNPGGSSDPVTFTYTPPVVSGVSPSSGSTSGGTAVAIRGSGLAKVTSVRFGARPATQVVARSDSEVDVVSPAADRPGPVDVVVADPGDTSARSAGSGFIYTSAPPRVAGLDPSCGPVGDGGTVTVSGAGLSEASSVHFGAVPAGAVHVVSDSVLKVTAPALAVGHADVTVTTPQGTSPVRAVDLYTTPCASVINNTALPGPSAPGAPGPGIAGGSASPVGPAPGLGPSGYAPAGAPSPG